MGMDALIKLFAVTDVLGEYVTKSQMDNLARQIRNAVQIIVIIANVLLHAPVYAQQDKQNAAVQQKKHAGIIIQMDAMSGRSVLHALMGAQIMTAIHAI